MCECNWTDHFSKESAGASPTSHKVPWHHLPSSTLLDVFSLFLPSHYEDLWQTRSEPTQDSLDCLRHSLQTSLTAPSYVAHGGEIRLSCCKSFTLVTGWDLNINGALLESPAAQPASRLPCLSQANLRKKKKESLNIWFVSSFFSLSFILSLKSSAVAANIKLGRLLRFCKRLQNGAEAEQHTDLKHTWGRERQGRALN